MIKHTPCQVGEFLDISNLRISATEEYGPEARIDFERLREFVGSLGNSCVAKAFCVDTGNANAFFHYLRRAGYDVEILMPKAMPNGTQKGNVDPLLAFALCEAVAQYRLRTVVLGSGDVDFTPVVKILRHRKVEVIVIGPSPRHTASELVFAATRFYTLSDLNLLAVRPRPDHRLGGEAGGERNEALANPLNGNWARNGAMAALHQKG